MTKPIGSIIWPATHSDAARLLQLFMIKVVERLGIAFDPRLPNPIAIAKERGVGAPTHAARKAALTAWWEVIDAKGVRNFEKHDVLVARLAVCLLSPDDGQAHDLSEQLSWFLEVLGFLGTDVDKAIELMEQHFDFAS